MKKNDFEYRVARSKDELEQAYALVYKEYKRRGYIPKMYKSNLRLSLYNALPSTTTFIALKNGKVAATVTLLPDSGLGILMDKLFKKEVDRLRKKGRRVAEVSQLAIDSAIFPQQWFSMFNFTKLIFMFRLFRLVHDHALYVEKIDDLCIAFNPRHRSLYKFLQFEDYGKLRYYGSFHSPAIAMRLDLRSLEEKYRHKKALHKLFYGGNPDMSRLKDKYLMTISDLEYFFIKKSDFLVKADARQKKVLKELYGSGNIQGLLKKV